MLCECNVDVFDIIHFRAMYMQVHVFITNKLHQLKYAELLLWHVSAIENSHPQGVLFHKGSMMC